MTSVRDRQDFVRELRRRLNENRRLYRDDSPFLLLDSPFSRFVAARLGVNPWKVLVPAAVAGSFLLRVVFGRGFSDLVLRALGGE